MKTRGWNWIVLMAIVTALSGVSYGEKESDAPQLSAALKAVVKALFPTASVEGVKAEMEGIRVVEIELKEGDKECSIDMAEDGTVISVESQVAPDALPKAVAKAIKEKARGAEISVIEKEEIRAEVKVVVLKKPKTVYETKFVKDGKEFELQVAASGAILAFKPVQKEQENEDEEAVEEKDDDGKDQDADEGNEGDDEEEDDDDNGKVVTSNDKEDSDADEDEDDGDDDGEDEDQDEDKDKDGDKESHDDADKEQSKAISLNDVPKPVRETILKQAKGGKVEEIEKETEDGKTIYDADIVIDGKKFELKVGENGKLLSKQAEEDDKNADEDEKDDEGDEDQEDDDSDKDKDQDRDEK